MSSSSKIRWIALSIEVVTLADEFGIILDLDIRGNAFVFCDPMALRRVPHSRRRGPFLFEDDEVEAISIGQVGASFNSN